MRDRYTERDRNDRNNERDRNRGCQSSRDSDRNRDRDSGSDRDRRCDRRYTLTQRSSKLFPESLTRIPPNALAQALHTLEVSALQNIQDFGAQGIANTLHIMAKQRYKATGPLLLALGRRAEAISGEFKSQNVANTRCVAICLFCI